MSERKWESEDGSVGVSTFFGGRGNGTMVQIDSIRGAQCVAQMTIAQFRELAAALPEIAKGLDD